MSVHASRSPSKAKRWMNCPGSVYEESKRPPKPSNPAAISGTHTHTVVDHCIKHDLVDPIALVNTTFKDKEGEFVLDHARAERAKVAIDYVRKRYSELNNPKLLSETFVDPGVLIRRDDMGGYADIQLFDPAVYEVIDYKDGVMVVEPDDVQIRLYGIGAIGPQIVETGHTPFETIRLTVIQPKVTQMSDLKAVRSVDISSKELLRWFDEEVVPAVKRTDIDTGGSILGVIYNPGDWCKFCVANGDCVARAKKSLAHMQMLFGDADLADQSSVLDANVMSDEQIREVIEASGLIRGFLEDVAEEALRRFAIGHKIEGLKTVRGRGSNQWSVDDEQLEKILRGMGVPKSAVYVNKIVSPAQIKKLKWEKRGGEKRTLTKRQQEKLKTEYVKRNPGKLRVVSESDEREAFDINPKGLFEGLQKEQMPVWLQ